MRDQVDFIAGFALTPNAMAVAPLATEANMGLVFRFAERISVLVAGRVLCEGTPDEISKDARVREVYLGGAVP